MLQHPFPKPVYRPNSCSHIALTTKKPGEWPLSSPHAEEVAHDLRMEKGEVEALRTDSPGRRVGASKAGQTSAQFEPCPALPFETSSSGIAVRRIRHEERMYNR